MIFERKKVDRPYGSYAINNAVNFLFYSIKRQKMDSFYFLLFQVDVSFDLYADFFFFILLSNYNQISGDIVRFIEHVFARVKIIVVTTVLKSTVHAHKVNNRVYFNVHAMSNFKRSNFKYC